MSDEELKLNRRRFLQHTAVGTAAAGAWYSITMKTDAVAQTGGTRAPESGGHNVLPYQYSSPP